MHIEKEKVYDYLKSIGVKHLYHANTVQTSCTFIQNGGLLSRGDVERRNLLQTVQDSDDSDKLYDVWDDIFLDSVDLHEYFSRQNYYGPVVFKFKIEVLLHTSLPDLWITKDNPFYWNDSQNSNERYFSSINELVSDYCNERQKKMITLRKTMEVLPFNPYLEAIIFDNPNVIVGDIDLYSKGKMILEECLVRNGMSTNLLHIRKCENCYCHSNYLYQVGGKRLKKLFLWDNDLVPMLPIV